MEKGNCKKQDSLGIRKKKFSRILPDSIADIAILFGLATIVTCILFGLEGGDDE